MKTLLIDGDEWAYKAAHSGQCRWYKAMEGDREIFRGKRRQEVIQHIGNRDWELEDELEDLGAKPAYARLREWIEDIVKDIEEGTGGSTQLKVYLTGKSNFRYNLATILPYKGNRDPGMKPIYLQEIRDYLTSEYGATFIDYLEADDMMSANQSDDTIIVTQDKDLNMVPGLRYNTSQSKLLLLEEPYCTRFHYTQILTGDSTDNIPGLSFVGEKTALNMLEGMDTPEAMYQTVLLEYNKRMVDGKHYITKGKKKGEILWETEKTPAQAVWEVANLLWMRRELYEEAYWEAPSDQEGKERLSKAAEETQVDPVESKSVAKRLAIQKQEVRDGP